MREEERGKRERERARKGGDSRTVRKGGERSIEERRREQQSEERRREQGKVAREYGKEVERASKGGFSPVYCNTQLGEMKYSDKCETAVTRMQCNLDLCK